jgi:hypothetical protein
MGGIAGIINFDGKPVPHEEMIIMTITINWLHLVSPVIRSTFPVIPMPTRSTTHGRWALIYDRGSKYDDCPWALWNLLFCDVIFSNESSYPMNCNPTLTYGSKLAMNSEESYSSKAILSNDIKSISALASASACFRLCVPNSFDALPDIRSRIVAHTNSKPL